MVNLEKVIGHLTKKRSVFHSEADFQHDLNRFYELLENLRQRVGGYRYLENCDSRSGWPRRGVYFFFEHGEDRTGGQGLRVVRVGTHAISDGAKTTLWHRLRQHKGTTGGEFPGGGNHRESVFRLHVGAALINRGSYPAEISQTWRRRGSIDRRVRKLEYLLEMDVSHYIRGLSFLWLDVPGEAGKRSERKEIERNAVALLSNCRRALIDPPSQGWLGNNADNMAVRESGLWNVDHVDDRYDPLFLEGLAGYIRKMGLAL